MINPRSKVHLKWSTLKDSHPIDEFEAEGISCILGQDMIIPVTAAISVSSKCKRNTLPIWQFRYGIGENFMKK